MRDRELRPEVYLARCQPFYDNDETEDSPVGAALRGIWGAMRLDPNNPFRGDLAPGGLAVIKPNWVLHDNPSGGGLDCLITHRSLVYRTALHCARALEGRGRIVIGDCPIQECDFQALLEKTRIGEIVGRLRRAYPGVEIEIQDWRLTTLPRVAGKGAGYTPCRQTLHDQAQSLAENYQELDAGNESFLEGVSEYANRFRVTMYKPSLMHAHHQPGVHRYLLRKEPLQADLLINLAKMKTHAKAGLTGAMKNLVGLNGHKEYLPHHVKGSYFTGGDSFFQDNHFAAWAEDVYDLWWEGHNERSALGNWLLSHAYQACRAACRLTGGGRVSPGGWSGNDTVWRMTLDLNHLVYFGPCQPKRILNIVDGIIAGEGNGPLKPTAKQAGVILAGENPAHVDAVIGRLIGYNIHRIPTVFHAVCHRRSKFGGLAFDRIPVFLLEKGGAAIALDWHKISPLGFTPPPNWKRALCLT